MWLLFVLAMYNQCLKDSSLQILDGILTIRRGFHVCSILSIFLRVVRGFLFILILISYA